ncbi:MAG: diguanylate cyclase [Bryobacteraceae bacterium]|jgi:PAS domain S-box-containing protein/diguanylate cyclase (GGDEF)-like protein
MPGELDTSVYKTILEDLPSGVYGVNLDGRIRFWNGWAERISGYLRQEVIGRACSENLLMHCDADNNLLCGSACHLQQTMRDGRMREADLFLRHKDGQRVPVRVRSIAVRDAEGSVIGAAESFDERLPRPEPQWHPGGKPAHGDLDPLTGVLDGPSTETYLRRCIHDFAEDGIPFGILAIAIDDLDGIRERRGEQAMERVLRMVAATLSKNLPGVDVVGRWRRNWFLVIVDKCPAAALPRIGATLRPVVGAAAFSWWGDRLSVTIAVGGAEAVANDTVESLLARCEQALEASIGRGGDGMTIA